MSTMQVRVAIIAKICEGLTWWYAANIYGWMRFRWYSRDEFKSAFCNYRKFDVHRFENLDGFGRVV